MYEASRTSKSLAQLSTGAVLAMAASVLARTWPGRGQRPALRAEVTEAAYFEGRGAGTSVPGGDESAPTSVGDRPARTAGAASRPHVPAAPREAGTVEGGGDRPSGLESDHFLSPLHGHPVEVDERGDIGGRQGQADEGEVPHDLRARDEADEEEEEHRRQQRGDDPPAAQRSGAARDDHGMHVHLALDGILTRSGLVALLMHPLRCGREADRRARQPQTSSLSPG